MDKENLKILFCFFLSFLSTKSHFVAQASLKTCDPIPLASTITGMYHCTQLNSKSVSASQWGSLILPTLSGFTSNVFYFHLGSSPTYGLMPRINNFQGIMGKGGSFAPKNIAKFPRKQIQIWLRTTDYSLNSCLSRT